MQSNVKNALLRVVGLGQVDDLSVFENTGGASEQLLAVMKAKQEKQAQADLEQTADVILKCVKQVRLLVDGAVTDLRRARADLERAEQLLDRTLAVNEAAAQGNFFPLLACQGELGHELEITNKLNEWLKSDECKALVVAAKKRHTDQAKSATKRAAKK
jgi:hypothetical protein